MRSAFAFAALVAAVSAHCPNLEETQWCTYKSALLTGGSATYQTMMLYEQCIEEICNAGATYDATAMYKDADVFNRSCPTAYHMEMCYGELQYYRNFDWVYMNTCLQSYCPVVNDICPSALFSMVARGASTDAYGKTDYQKYADLVKIECADDWGSSFMDLPFPYHRQELRHQATVTTQYTVANGGGTRGEFPPNLLFDGEEPWNKWYENSSSSSWVKITNNSRAVPLQFEGLGFKSANDVPDRDPQTVKVTATWFGIVKELGTFNLKWSSRWSLNKFALDMSIPADEVLFEFYN